MLHLTAHTFPMNHFANCVPIIKWHQDGCYLPVNLFMHLLDDSECVSNSTALLCGLQQRDWGIQMLTGRGSCWKTVCRTSEGSAARSLSAAGLRSSSETEPMRARWQSLARSSAPLLEEVPA